jgi:hypothetical protein
MNAIDHHVSNCLRTEHAEVADAYGRGQGHTKLLLLVQGVVVRLMVEVRPENEVQFVSALRMAAQSAPFIDGAGLVSYGRSGEDLDAVDSLIGYIETREGMRYTRVQTLARRGRGFVDPPLEGVDAIPPELSWFFHAKDDPRARQTAMVHGLAGAMIEAATVVHERARREQVAAGHGNRSN